MPAFTPSQQRILEAIAEFDRKGEPVLVPQLVRRLGLAAESSLTQTLGILERKGAIRVRGGGVKGRPRVVTLAPAGRRAVGMGGLPLLGAIPAGPLSEAVEHAEQVLGEGELLPWKEGGLFCCA